MPFDCHGLTWGQSGVIYFDIRFQKQMPKVHDKSSMSNHISIMNSVALAGIQEWKVEKQNTLQVSFNRWTVNARGWITNWWKTCYHFGSMYMYNWDDWSKTRLEVLYTDNNKSLKAATMQKLGCSEIALPPRLQCCPPLIWKWFRKHPRIFLGHIWNKHLVNIITRNRELYIN